MKRSGIYKRWDIVVVHYPFIEGTEAKRRPALIVSGNMLFRNMGVYWAAMITTAKAGVKPDDIPITDLRRANLPEACVVRLARLTTLGEMQIAYQRGSLASRDTNAVRTLLAKYLV